MDIHAIVYICHTTIVNRSSIYHPLIPGYVAHGVQETERLMADPAPGISAVPHEDNLRYFDVVITGPEGSPFERTF